MQRNEAGIDRVLRVVIAVVAGAVAFVVGPTTGGGVALSVVAVVMLATAATGFCPIYRLLGISTCRVPADR